MKILSRFFGLLFCGLILVFSASAQLPELPNLKIETLKGNNIIQWFSTFNNVKTINIERLGDGAATWATIGFIKKPKKGKRSFTDTEPLLGSSKYRLKIIFGGDVEWYSNTYTVNLTAEMLAQSGRTVIKSGSSDVEEYKSGNVSSDATATTSAYTDFYYEPSTQVYTNPYTGHINITLGDARRKRYSIKFFDPNKNEILEISRVKHTEIILDKYNFNATGIYFFQLYDGEDLVETGYVTVY